MKRPTIKQIARLAGVNISTVSRALNPASDHPISEDLRTRILAIAEKLNYEPKTCARSLVNGKSYNIGIALNRLERDLASPFLSIVFAAFCRSVNSHGYNFCLLPLNGGTDIDQAVVKTVRSGNMDGYLIGTSLLGERGVAELTNHHIPCVVLGDKITSPEFAKIEVNTVTVDETTAAKELAAELARLGHKRVAYYLNTTPGSPMKRCIAFRQAAAAAGIQVSDEDIIVHPLTHGPLTVRSEIRELATAEWDRFSGYSAILCQSDLAALGIIDVIKFRGLSPGKEISVVGYDNIEENPNYCCTEPILTTIDKNNQLIGCTMADLLLRQIAKADDLPQTAEIPTRLVRRNTLGKAVS